MPVAQFFTSFSKKRNSTKRPTIDPQYNVNVEFKAPTDIFRPTVIIRGVDSYEHVTYMYMDGWYYYVNSIVSNRDFWEVTAELDEFATWAGDIQGASLMIARCADKKNGVIADNLAIAEGVTNLQHMDVETGNPIGTTGVYVVAIMGNNTTSYLATGNIDAYNELLSNLCDPTKYDGTLPQGFNPLDYVYKSYFIPFFPTGTPVRTVGVGIYKCNVTAQVVSFPLGYTGTITQNFTHPVHPKLDDVGNWLNQAPYTERVLRMPPFGDIRIDYPASATGLNTEIKCDCSTGDAVLTCSIDGINVAQRYSNLAVDLLISHTLNPTAGEFATSVIKDVSRLVTDTMRGNIGDGVNTIYNAIQNIRDGGKGYTNHGSQGSLASFKVAPQYINVFTPIVEPDYVNMGHAYMKKETIGSHAGFVMCATGDISTTAPEPYKTNIRNALKGGIYIE